MWFWKKPKEHPAESKADNGFELVPSLRQVGVKYNVCRYCRTAGQNPTDEEFLDIYSLMRRRPDGKSMGRLHDVVWQSAALVLGLRPWSEAEYTAVFGQLTRSARHFHMGPSSRNYLGYVRKEVGQEA